MICIFGCDKEEARAFEAAAQCAGAEIAITPESLNVKGAMRVPKGSVVSVSHKSTVGAPILDALRERDVEYLNTRSVGIDHIDTAYAKATGIEVEGVAYSPESVAEHAVLLMLMAVRSIAPVLMRGKRGDYRLAEQRAGTLCGMTVGVVGTGRIGRCVIGILRGFDCHLLGYDPMPSAPVRYKSLEQLLAQSDIVTLHLPLTEETRHLMNHERIAGMKRGAILINVARGGLVDSDDLADALESGCLSGAALDVVDGEEGWFYHDCAGGKGAPFERLLALPNVIITPHCAFYTRRALSDIVENTLHQCMKHERMLEKWIV